MVSRETAWRAFAGEYKDSDLEEKGEGEMAPSYVITPLGAKLNRIFIVGTLMEVEKRENDVKATFWDGTDTVALYANKYNQEAMDSLLKMSVPCYAAVLARVRTFSPEEGRIFVTVKPDQIREATLEERDYWILSAAEQTLYRIEAFGEASKMDPPNSEKMGALGYASELSDGIIKSLSHYSNPDIAKYREIVAGAIASIAGGEQQPVLAPKQAEQEAPKTAPQKVPVQAPKPAQSAQPKPKTGKDEEAIIEIVKALDSGKGASWEDVVSKAETHGMDKNKIEELIIRLEDAGTIEEPFLGQLRLKK